MSLREYLETYKSVAKIYLEEYVDSNNSNKIALFQSIKSIPREYLDYEVISWNYVLEVVDMQKILMIPVAKLKMERGWLNEVGGIHRVK